MNIKVSQNPSQRNSVPHDLHVEGGAPCERVPVFRWNSQADLALVSAAKVHTRQLLNPTIFVISMELM